MAHIQTGREEEARGPVAQVYEAAVRRTGKVAHIVKLMSLDAPVLQGSMALYVNLMKAPNALDAARREMLATVVSNINDCYY